MANQKTQSGDQPPASASPPSTQQSVDAFEAFVLELQRRAAISPEQQTRDRNVSFAGAGFSIVDLGLQFRPAISVDPPFPPSGARTGGDTVSFSGVNLLPGTTVSFGNKAAEVTVKSSTEIEAITPPSTSAGAVDVTVRSFGGARLLSGAFTYDP